VAPHMQSALTVLHAPALCAQSELLPCTGSWPCKHGSLKFSPARPGIQHKNAEASDSDHAYSLSCIMADVFSVSNLCSPKCSTSQSKLHLSTAGQLATAPLSRRGLKGSRPRPLMLAEQKACNSAVACSCCAKSCQVQVWT